MLSSNRYSGSCQLSFDLLSYRVKTRVSSILFFALVAHISVSVFFILDPPGGAVSRVSRVYKTHLLPGPFFTAPRLIDNYSLCVSWKIKGQWSPMFDPAKEDFNLYHSSLNLSDLYRSRISRTLYLRLALLDSSATNINNRREFIPVRQFLEDHYIPKEADSVRMLMMNKQVNNFTVRTDSMYITFAR